jgi:hypothetical protein
MAVIGCNQFLLRRCSASVRKQLHRPL